MREEVGEVSLLISNAGIISVGEFLKVSDERVQKIIEVNFIAQYWVSDTDLIYLLTYFITSLHTVAIELLYIESICFQLLDCHAVQSTGCVQYTKL